jgi:hypothetical protein
MRWRVVAGFVCFLVLAGVVCAGGYAVVRYVIRPAEHNASGPIPNPSIKEVSGGPSITFATTTVPRTTTTKPATTSKPNPSLVAATAALAKAAPSLQHTVVATGSAFAAATWDQYGHIEFWSYANGTWTTAASRLYPPDAGDGSGSYSSAAGVQVTGQVLAGTAEPIFIVSGHFSSDQADNDLAFAYGSNGWGVLVPQGNGQLGSDGGSLTYLGPGLEWGERFVAGRFETLQRPSGWEEDFDSLFPVTELWSWQGEALSLVDSNVVTAQIEAAPASSAASLPAGGSVPDGLYAGRIESVSTIGSSSYPLLRLKIASGTVSLCNGSQVCFQPTGGTVSVAVGATTATDYAVTGGSGATWISGPAWGLDVPGGICCSDGYRVVPTQLQTFGASAWYVPAQLGVQSFLEATQPIVEMAYAGGRVTTIYEPTGNETAG